MTTEVVRRPLQRQRDPEDRRANLRRAAEHAVLGFGPVAACLLLLAFQFKIHAVAVDFHSAYYPALVRLLHGGNPYGVSHRDIIAGTAFVYPALSAVALAPFAALGRGVGEIVYMLVCIACVPATLRTLNVRDWRAYGIVFFWLPIYGGWQTANVTLPLMLMTALVWRHRDRPIVAGLVTAAAISLKPFVWPLGLWLLATRRFRAAAFAFGWGLVINVLAWAIVGFNEVRTYLHLSSEVTAALWRGGYSMLAVAHHLGLGRSAGETLLLVVSAAAGLALVYLGVVKRRDREAFSFAVVLMLVASPLVWAHYFALLLVPIALYRSRLSPLWAVPILMWPLPESTQVVGWQVALGWALTVACVLVTVRTPQAGPRSGGSSKVATKEARGRMLDWAMALARPDLAQKKSLPRLHPERQRCRVSASWPTTSMGSQPIVQDNESTDPPLSRDGKI